jgi:hypothetical protein
MSACCSETGCEIADRAGPVHREYFFGIDLPKRRPGSAITGVPWPLARAKARLVGRQAMHTGPQLSFDHFVPAREPRTP